MATINVSGAFRSKNNILRTLLHKGQPNEVLTLRLWGPTSRAIGGIMLLASTTDGWNHKQSKIPETDRVVESLKVSESSTVTEAIMKKATGCDIVYADNTFARYTFDGKAQKNPITKEWRVNVAPNFADTQALTVPPPPSP
jgi:hypothetical protein